MRVTLETGRWKTRRDLPVWVALAVLLIAGWELKSSVEDRRAAFADPTGTLRVQYPFAWLAVPGSTALLDVSDPRSGAGVATRLIVTKTPRPADQAAGDIANGEILRRAQQLNMYRALSAEPAKVAGKDAVAVSYAFVADPHEAALELQRIPVVVRGLEIVIPAGDIVYRIDFRADTAVFDAARPTLDRILRDVKL